MKGEVDAEPWMGRRPTLIDSLPIVGPAPRHKGLWFNFGHQHLGLSMAPGSAKLITSMINGEAPPIDASPYRADRFPV
jgi:D-amino-acid dehydrogenase